MKILIWGKHAVNQGKRYGKIIQLIDDERLIKKLLGSNVKHQNIAAYVDFKLYSIDSFYKEKRILMLDGITDTGNLGSIIRSAAALGWNHIVLSKKMKASMNGTVIRISSGGFFHVKIAIENILTGLARLKKKGFKIIGLSEKGSNDDIIRHDKQVIVIGDENDGIQCESHCDHIWSITNNKFSTLNASIAASIAMYELHRSV